MGPRAAGSSCSSKCGLQTGSSGSWLEMPSSLVPTPDLQNQNLHFNKIPEDYACTLKFGKPSFKCPSLQPTEYQRLPDSTIPQEDYRCWPSYHHGGCLLSVFSLAEAVDICENHAQCQAFVVTNQTTWTGELGKGHPEGGSPDSPEGQPGSGGPPSEARNNEKTRRAEGMRQVSLC